MTFKFNGGYGAVLCDNCHTIVASGKKSFELLFADEPENKYSVNDLNIFVVKNVETNILKNKKVNI